jgi:copper(I)-binding protein
MLVDLAHPLAAGTAVPLTLTFEKAGTVDISATVEPAAGGAQSKHVH